VVPTTCPCEVAPVEPVCTSCETVATPAVVTPEYAPSFGYSSWGYGKFHHKPIHRERPLVARGGRK